jgi:hypothetical protein
VSKASAEALQASAGRLGCHRLGGRPHGDESRRDTGPVVYDLANRCAGAAGTGVVGRAHDEIAAVKIIDALTCGIDDPGQLQPDATPEHAREQPAAQRSISCVQCTRAATRTRPGCGLETAIRSRRMTSTSGKDMQCIARVFPLGA